MCEDAGGEQCPYLDFDYAADDYFCTHCDVPHADGRTAWLHGTITPAWCPLLAERATDAK